MHSNAITPVRFGGVIALAAAAVIGLSIPLHYARAVQRPEVQPSSELERLRWSLEAQSRQIESDRLSLAKYNRALTEQSSTVSGLQAAYNSANRSVAAARARWNSEVNPTCDHGQTYANCSCQSGTIGKARMSDVIRRAEERAKNARSSLEGAKRKYDDLAAKARRLRTQYNAALDAYRQGVETYNRMLNQRPR